MEKKRRKRKIKIKELEFFVHEFIGRERAETFQYSDIYEYVPKKPAYKGTE